MDFKYESLEIVVHLAPIGEPATGMFLTGARRGGLLTEARHCFWKLWPSDLAKGNVESK
jgi:hypothetical protein